MIKKIISVCMFITVSSNSIYFGENKGVATNTFTPGLLTQGVNAYQSLFNYLHSQIACMNNPQLFEILASFNNLVKTNNIDMIDQMLTDFIKKVNAQLPLKSHIPYLRLTVKYKDQIDALMKKVEVKDGKIVCDEKGELPDGPLAQIIEQGGILLLDLGNCSPKLIDGMNMLFFAHNAAYRGIRRSPHLIVVGAIEENTHQGLARTFDSRYTTLAKVEGQWQDPLDQIEEVNVQSLPPDSFISMDLFYSPLYDQKLTGMYRVQKTDEGAAYIQAMPGALVQAISENKSIVIYGGNWEDLQFRHYIRQILIKGSVEYNGILYPLPQGFRIFRGEKKYEEGVEHKSIMGYTENPDEKVWIINDTTKDILLVRTSIEHGVMIQHKGLLEDSSAHLRLRVTGKLSPWVWHIIMHAKASLQIEVSADGLDSMPEEYKKFQVSNTTQKPLVPQQDTDIARALAAKTSMVSTDDFGLACAKIARVCAEMQKKVFFVSVTPSTSLRTMSGQLRVFTLEGGKQRQYTFEKKDLALLLAQENNVIVYLDEGNNPSFAQEIEPLLCEDPYLLMDGESLDAQRFSLKDAKSQVVYLAGTSAKAQAFCRVNLAQKSAEVYEILKAEYALTSQEWEMLEQFCTLATRIIAVRDPSFAATAPLFGLEVMRNICALQRTQEGNTCMRWTRAFDLCVLNSLAHDEQLVAYLRVQIKRLFSDPLSNDRRTIAVLPLKAIREKLTRYNHATSIYDRCAMHYWELADCFGDGFIKECNIGADFFPDQATQYLLLKTVGMALAQASSDNPAKVAYYGNTFGFSQEEFKTWQPGIFVSEEQDFDTQLALCGNLFASDSVRAFELIGDTGTGKTHLCSRIPSYMQQHFGYSSKVFHFTMGPDFDESDVTEKQVFEQGKTNDVSGVVAQWASSGPSNEMRFLFVDEYDLARPGFWNFLEGAFDTHDPHVWINGKRKPLTKWHKIIFTGNGAGMQGRYFHRMVKTHFATLYCEEYSGQYVQKIIRADFLDFLPEHYQMLGADMMYTLHKMFAQKAGRRFTLRDLMSAAARIEYMLKDKPIESPAVFQKIVYAAMWQEYKDNFDQNERVTLMQLVFFKYGITLADAMDLYQKQYWPILPDPTSMTSNTHVLVATESTRALRRSMHECLDMRDAYASGKISLMGKRAFVIEGPSGRGKDDIGLHEFQRHKYHIVYHLQEVAETEDKTKVCYFVNASVDDYQTLIDIITKAKREGSVVFISEMNLLSSAVLEGVLNGALTGDDTLVHKGFMLVATINSADYHGREVFSGALVNRVHFQRLADYTFDELCVILREQGIKTLTKDDIRMLAVIHCGLRVLIKDPKQHPNTREMILVINAVKAGRSVSEALRAVYVPRFSQAEDLINAVERYAVLPLEGTLRDSVIIRTVLDELYRGQEYATMATIDVLVEFFSQKDMVDNALVLDMLNTYINPVKTPVACVQEASMENGGSYDSINNITQLNRQLSLIEKVHTVVHECGHAWFTGRGKEADDFWKLYMALEDNRMEHAVITHLFPYFQDSFFDQVEGFAKALEQKSNIRAVIAAVEKTAGPRGLFQIILLAYARGRISYEQIRFLQKINRTAGIISSELLEVAKKIYQMIPEGADHLCADEIDFAYQEMMRMINTSGLIQVYCALPRIQEREDAVSHDVEKEKQQSFRDRRSTDLSDTFCQPKSQSAIKPIDPLMQSLLAYRGAIRFMHMIHKYAQGIYNFFKSIFNRKKKEKQNIHDAHTQDAIKYSAEKYVASNGKTVLVQKKPFIFFNRILHVDKVGYYLIKGVEIACIAVFLYIFVWDLMGLIIGSITINNISSIHFPVIAYFLMRIFFPEFLVYLMTHPVYKWPLLLFGIIPLPISNSFLKKKMVRNVVHGHSEQKASTAQERITPLQEAKVIFTQVQITLDTMRARMHRNPVLLSISHKSHAHMQRILSQYFYDSFSSSKKVYKYASGADVDLVKLHTNPLAACARLDTIAETKTKEIIVINDNRDQMISSDFLSHEVICCLLERGFKITEVYCFDPKEKDAVIRCVQKQRRTGEYVITSMDQIQKEVEGEIYLTGLIEKELPHDFIASPLSEYELDVSQKTKKVDAMVSEIMKFAHAKERGLQAFYDDEKVYLETTIRDFQKEKIFSFDDYILRPLLYLAVTNEEKNFGFDMPELHSEEEKEYMAKLLCAVLMATPYACIKEYLARKLRDLHCQSQNERVLSWARAQLDKTREVLAQSLVPESGMQKNIYFQKECVCAAPAVLAMMGNADDHQRLLHEIVPLLLEWEEVDDHYQWVFYFGVIRAIRFLYQEEAVSALLAIMKRISSQSSDKFGCRAVVLDALCSLVYILEAIADNDLTGNMLRDKIFYILDELNSIKNVSRNVSWGMNWPPQLIFLFALSSRKKMSPSVYPALWKTDRFFEIVRFSIHNKEKIDSTYPVTVPSPAGEDAGVKSPCELLNVCCQLLGCIGSKKAVDMLVSLYNNAKNDSEQQCIIHALRDAGDMRVVPWLLALLQRSDSFPLSEAILDTLSVLRDKRAESVLLNILEEERRYFFDPSHRVYMQGIITALEQIGCSNDTYIKLRNLELDWQQASLTVLYQESITPSQDFRMYEKLGKSLMEIVHSSMIKPLVEIYNKMTDTRKQALIISILGNIYDQQTLDTLKLLYQSEKEASLKSDITCAISRLEQYRDDYRNRLMAKTRYWLSHPLAKAFVFMCQRGFSDREAKDFFVMQAKEYVAGYPSDQQKEMLQALCTLTEPNVKTIPERLAQNSAFIPLFYAIAMYDTRPIKSEIFGILSGLSHSESIHAQLCMYLFGNFNKNRRDFFEFCREIAAQKDDLTIGPVLEEWGQLQPASRVVVSNIPLLEKVIQSLADYRSFETVVYSMLKKHDPAKVYHLLERISQNITRGDVQRVIKIFLEKQRAQLRAERSLVSAA